MTVLELMNKLNHYPGDMLVVVNAEKNELANGQTPTTVEELVYVFRDGQPYRPSYYPPDPDDAETEGTVLNISA